VSPGRGACGMLVRQTHRATQVLWAHTRCHERAAHYKLHTPALEQPLTALQIAQRPGTGLLGGQRICMVCS
jgi:hypothetical protein